MAKWCNQREEESEKNNFFIFFYKQFQVFNHFSSVDVKCGFNFK